jgi:hypothetical protein
MGVFDGRCLCGAVTYNCDADPIGTFLCHCRDCQRQSGAPVSIVVAVPSDAFEMRGDTLTMWETASGDSGEPRERWFCNRCGSPIITVMTERPELTIIKAGTLDDVSQLQPIGELWTETAHEWWEPGKGRRQFERGLTPT